MVVVVVVVVAGMVSSTLQNVRIIQDIESRFPQVADRLNGVSTWFTL